jgi:hypothetical protein
MRVSVHPRSPAHAKSVRTPSAVEEIGYQAGECLTHALRRHHPAPVHRWTRCVAGVRAPAACSATTGPPSFSRLATPQARSLPIISHHMTLCQFLSLDHSYTLDTSVIIPAVYFR